LHTDSVYTTRRRMTCILRARECSAIS
jgi:hypothetical protein